MKKIILIMTLLGMVLIKGCGGSNNKDLRILVDAYGESTFTGFGLKDPKASTPAYIQEIIPTIRINNRSVNGTTTRQQLDGTDGLNLPWVHQLETSSAKYIIINRGINEAFKGTPTLVFEQDFTLLVQEAKRLNKVILIQTSNITCIDPIVDAQVDVNAQVVRDVAKRENVLVSDGNIISKSVVSTTSCKEEIPDGLHPSERMQHAIAEEDARQLLTILK